MGIGVDKKKLKQKEYFVVRDTHRSNIVTNTIFPNGIQVGINDPEFKAGIRIFGQVDTSDDILLFGNSMAAAVLDIDLNPASVIIFGDPADKEVFIQPATITADAAYASRQMQYDGLATAKDNVSLDFSYRPFFAGITGDNGITTISNVVVNAPTGSVKNPLTGSVRLTDTHGTMFMTLDFASDASTGDLTIQPSLSQVRTNNKEITNITLKIPFAAKSNNPKPLILKKEVHIQKLEFPTTANYFTTPSVYVLRKNSSNQFSTLDLKAVPYSVNYVEGYNYGSGATEVSASNLIPNATGSVGSVNTLANGSFTIKSVRDLFCSSSSASTMVQPATTGSDRYKVRLTALSGADDNATFAAREIETLYKTTTGLVGSDRILQQFIIQETRESVKITSTDRVLYVKSTLGGGGGTTKPLFFDALSGSNIDGIRTLDNGPSTAKFYSEQITSENLLPNRLAMSSSVFFLPLDHAFSGSSIDSNLAGISNSLMSVTSSNMFTSHNNNESIRLPAGHYQVSMKAQFLTSPTFTPGNNKYFAFYVVLVKSISGADSQDIFDFQPSNKRSSWKIMNTEIQASDPQLDNLNHVRTLENGTKSLIPWKPGARYTNHRIQQLCNFNYSFVHNETSAANYTLVPVFQFGPVTLGFPKTPGGGVSFMLDPPIDCTVPTLERTNLTMTVTEL